MCKHYLNVGYIADDLRQLIFHLGSRRQEHSFLSASAQNFMLADNLAACAPAQDDESAAASNLLGQHWRLLTPSKAFNYEDLTEG